MRSISNYRVNKSRPSKEDKLKVHIETLGITESEKLRRKVTTMKGWEE